MRQPTRTYSSLRSQIARYARNYCERSEPVTRVGWRISLVYIYIYI